MNVELKPTQFKYGNTRVDGFRFSNYRLVKGIWKEIWHSPESWARTKERSRHYFRRYNHGVTPEIFNSKIEAQNNCCAICKSSFDGMPIKNIHIDHDHVTGVVRDILCTHCNTFLGFARDDVEFLNRAIAYLLKHKTVS